MTVDIYQDTEIKAAHRSVWSSGDYPAVATEVIPELGPTLVRAVGIKRGENVLDIAAGSGNAAIAAAQSGARVIASDLTPELFEAGRRDAASAGVDVTWQQADAEDLPYDDASFDVALSTVGIMFTPFHQRSADELVRVVRPGGRIGLVNWTPGGFIGQVFAAMKPYAAPAPPGAQPPPLWGDPDHVAELLGDAVTDLHAERRVLAVDRFVDAEEFLDFFKRTYGPTIAVYNRHSGDPQVTAELDETLLALAREHFRPGQTTMDWEYLLVTASRV
jgi:SAM-dependent methyltransferase